MHQIAQHPDHAAQQGAGNNVGHIVVVVAETGPNKWKDEIERESEGLSFCSKKTRRKRRIAKTVEAPRKKRR